MLGIMTLRVGSVMEIIFYSSETENKGGGGIRWYIYKFEGNNLYYPSPFTYRSPRID